MKKLGLLAIAAGMMGVATTVPPQPPTTSPVFTETGAKEAPQPQQNKTNTTAQDQPKARQAYRATRSAGNSMFRGYGIPPKVYGMRYVKRGTHKRSNV